MPVVVATITPEDKWAIRLLTTYKQLAIIKEGNLEREISVFGDLFNTGILLNGIIDQLQYSRDKEELIVTDLKTRRTNTLPHGSQAMGHRLQVMIYKMLLDGMTRGHTKMDLLVEHLKLNFSTRLTRGVIRHIHETGMQSVFTPDEILCEEDLSTKITFGDFVQIISKLIQGLDLPPVSSLTIHYEHQGTNEVLGVDEVVFDEGWAKEMLESAVKFWMGDRESTGPDIEELEWKCGSCQFKSVCIWRKQKKLESSPYAKYKSPSKPLPPSNPSPPSKVMTSPAE